MDSDPDVVVILKKIDECERYFAHVRFRRALDIKVFSHSDV